MKSWNANKTNESQRKLTYTAPTTHTSHYTAQKTLVKILQ